MEIIIGLQVGWLAVLACLFFLDWISDKKLQKNLSDINKQEYNLQGNDLLKYQQLIKQSWIHQIK